MTISNAEIAGFITRYADLLAIDGANPFRIRAYRSAVRFLEGPSPSMAKLVAEGRNLDELPGIGKILSEKITTIVQTGALPQLAKLEERVPARLADLMELPGLGAKRVRLLYHKLGIHDLAALRSAIECGTVQALPGLGGKTLERLRAALKDKLRG